MPGHETTPPPRRARAGNRAGRLHDAAATAAAVIALILPTLGLCALHVVGPERGSELARSAIDRIGWIVSAVGVLALHVVALVVLWLEHRERSVPTKEK